MRKPAGRARILVQLLDVHTLAPGGRQGTTAKDCKVPGPSGSTREIAGVVRKNFVRTACPWRITPPYMRPAISRPRSRPDSRPFRASAQDVRDAINAGANPGPRLLTSIHQITEKSALLQSCVRWFARLKLKAAT